MFDFKVEEQQENGCEAKIIVEAVINQEMNRETVGFTYTFSIEEFIAEEPCPLKNDLFCSFISGGISTVTSLSYINSAITIAREVTSSTEFGPTNLLRFIYCLHSPPNSLVFNEYLNTNVDSDEETSQLNTAILNSLADTEINFIPANKTTVDSLITDIFSECPCGTISCENSQCVICLDNFLIGGHIVKLDCGHRFDRECIVKWLNTSHYCPVCKFQLPI